jgi:transposase
MQRHEPYRELGGDYFDKQRPDTTAKRLVKRLERLGSAVTLQQNPITGAA